MATYLYVSSDYTSSTEGWGTTHFSSYSSALNYAKTNAKSATIVMEKTTTVSGNCIDQTTHKNLSGLKVVVEDGAVMGNANSKWDMTYSVTINGGGVLQSARPASASYGNTHLKNTLTIGEADSKKRAVVNFVNGVNGITYKTMCITALYNGKIVANNADIYVGDLGVVGSGNFTDCNMYIYGSIGLGAHKSQTGATGSMTNCTVTVKGHNLCGDGTYYMLDSNRIANIVMDNSHITIDDGSDDTVADVVELGFRNGIFKKPLTMKNGSSITIEKGTDAKALWDVTISDSSISCGNLSIEGGAFVMTGKATMDIKALTIAEGLTLAIDSTSSLKLDSLAGAGLIQINIQEGFKGISKVLDFAGAELDAAILEKITLSNAAGYSAYIKEGDIYVASNLVVVNNAADAPEGTAAEDVFTNIADAISAAEGRGILISGKYTISQELAESIATANVQFAPDTVFVMEKDAELAIENANLTILAYGKEVELTDGVVDMSENNTILSANVGSDDADILITTGDAPVTGNSQIRADITGKDVELTNSKNLALLGSVKGDNILISNSGSDEENNEAILNAGSDKFGAKFEASENIIMKNDGHAVVDFKAKNILIANNSVNTLKGTIGDADTESIIIGTGSIEGTTLTPANGEVDGAIEDAIITAGVVTLADQTVTDTAIKGKTLINGDASFNGTTSASGVVKVVNGATLTINDSFTGTNLAAGDDSYFGFGDGSENKGGTIEINGTVKVNQVNADDAGIVKVNEDAVLNSAELCIENGAVENAASGSMIVDGTVNTASMRIFNGGSVEVNGTLNADQTDYPAGGYTNIDIWGNGSKLNINEGGEVNVKDDMRIQNGTELNINGGSLDVAYTLTNGSAIEISNGGSLTAGTLNNIADLTIAGITAGDAREIILTFISLEGENEGEDAAEVRINIGKNATSLSTTLPDIADGKYMVTVTDGRNSFLVRNVEIANGTINIENGSLTAEKLSIGAGSFQVSGESSINIANLTDGTIYVADETVFTDTSIAGSGAVSFAGTTNFYGENSITTALDGSVADFDFVVNEGASLVISRYTLGYDRDITVNGTIEDATALESLDGVTLSLKVNHANGFSIGGWGTHVLEVNNAYVDLGKSTWKNATGTYTWNFTNSYVKVGSFADNKAGASEDASWVTTFDDSILVSDGYFKSGKGMTINFINGSIGEIKSSMRMDGNLNIDETSIVNVAGYFNNKAGIADEHSDILGTINVAGELNIKGSGTVVELLDGGSINIKGGKLDLLADGTKANNILIAGDSALTMDGGELIAGNVTNNGTFAIGGESTVAIGTLTGSAAQVLDGAVLTDSTIAGYVWVMGEATFAGTTKINGVNLYGQSDAHLIIAEDATLATTDLVLRDGSSLTIYGDVTSNGISIGGAVTLDGGSLYGYVENYHADVTASFDLANGSTVTFTNAYKDVTVTTDVTSSLILSGTAYKAINLTVKDYTGDEKIFNRVVNLVKDNLTLDFSEFTSANENLIVINNDLYYSNVSQETIYVNEAYTGEFGDKVGEGKFLGVNAFGSFEDALAFAGENQVVSRMEIESDLTQATVANTSSYYDITQKLTIGAAEGVNVKVAVADGTSAAIRVIGNGASLAIEEGVEIDCLDVVADGFATSNEEMVINGKIHAVSLKVWTSNNGITVGETGKVVLGKGDGQFDMAYGNGFLNVTGTLTDTTDASLTDGPQFKAGYSGTRGNGNTLNLTNTYFEGGSWFNVNGSNGTFNLDNSVLKVSGGDAPGRLTIASSGNEFNVENGSRLIVANVTLGESNTIYIDGSSLEIATKLTNNGTLSVSGESTLKIGALEGNAAQIQDGAVLTNSTVGGKVVAEGDITIIDSTIGAIATGNNTVVLNGSVVFNSGNVDIGGYVTEDEEKVWFTDAEFIVKGDVDTRSSNGFYGKHGSTILIEEGASLTTSGKFQNNGDMTVKGTLTIENVDGDWLPKIAGTETVTSSLGGSLTIDGGLVSVDAGYLTLGGGQGSVWNDATGEYTIDIINGGILTTSAAGFRNSAKSTLTIDNARFIFTSPALVEWPNNNIYFDNAGSITVTNNGTLDMTGRALTNDGEILIDGGNFIAESVTNNGSLSVSAGSVTAATMENNGIVTVKDSDLIIGTLINNTDPVVAGNAYTPSMSMNGGSLTADVLKGSGNLDIYGNTQLDINTLEQHIRVKDGGTLSGDIGLLSGKHADGNAPTIYTYGNATLSGLNVNSDFTGKFMQAHGRVYLQEGNTTISGSNMKLNAFYTKGSGTIEADSVIGADSFNMWDSALEENTVFTIKGTLNIASFHVTINYQSEGDNDELIVAEGGVINGVGDAINGTSSGRFNIQIGTMTVYGFVNGNWNTTGGTAIIGTEGYADSILNVDGTYASEDSDNGKFINIGNQKLQIVSNGYVNVVNGGTFDWRNGALENAGTILVDTASNFNALSVKNTNSISVDDAVFTTGTLTNNGSFTVSGESRIVIDKATGNRISAASGTTLEDSYIGGGLTMEGDLTLDGDLTLTGGLWASNGGNLSGDTLSAYYAMFQKGTYTISSDLELDYVYLSYGGTFTVSSKIHTVGTSGEVFYVRGEVDLVEGAVLDADNSLYMDNDNAVLNVNTGAKIETDNLKLTATGAQLNVQGGELIADTLSNDGTFTVSGESRIVINKVTGNDVVVLDGALLTDSTIGGGNVDIVGNVTFAGETNLTGFTKIGYGTNSEEGDVMNVTGNAVINNAAVYNATLNIGSAEGDRTTVTGNIQNYISGSVVNIVNADLVYKNAVSITGIVTLTDSTYTVNWEGQINAGNGTGKLTLNNSSLEYTSYMYIGGYSGNVAADVELNDGSTLKGKTISTSATTTITINDSTLIAVNPFTNKGTITVSGESELIFNYIGKEGSSFTFADGTILSGDSKVTGTGAMVAEGDFTMELGAITGVALTVNGDLTLTGEFDIADYADKDIALFDNITLGANGDLLAIGQYTLSAEDYFTVGDALYQVVLDGSSAFIKGIADELVPVISNFTPVQSFSEDGTILTISVDATDDKEVASVFCTFNGVDYEMVRTEGNRYTCNVVVANDNSYGIANFLIKATDVRNQTATLTASAVYVADLVAPTIEVTGASDEITTEDVVITATVADLAVSGIAGSVKEFKYQINGGEWFTVDGLTTEIIMAENGTITFSATDFAGFTTTKVVEVANIDKAAPEIAVEGISDTITSSDVVVSALVTDNFGAVQEFKYQINGGEWVIVEGDSIEITMAENGTITFSATDFAGFTTTKTVEVANIDKIAPSITVEGISETVTNEDVVISALVTDNFGAVQEFKYQINGGEWFTVEDMTASIIMTENGKITFSATDFAGFTTDKTVEVSNIDKTAPELLVESNVDLATATNAETIALTAIYDTADVVKFEAVNKETNEVLTSENGVFNVGNGTYTFTIYDAAGNSTSQTVVVDNIIHKSLVNLYNENNVATSAAESMTDVAVGTNQWLEVLDGGSVTGGTIEDWGYAQVWGDITDVSLQGSLNENNQYHTGSLHLYGGASADSITVNKGGSMNVGGGVEATKTTINGGQVTVWGGAAVVDTNMEAGTLILKDNAAAANTVIGKDGAMHLYYGVTATVNTIAGYVGVGKGGSLINNELNAGASVTIWANGYAEESAINDGGVMILKQGATVNMTTVNVGGQLHIYDGASAFSTTVDGTSINVGRNGLLYSVNVEADASITLYNGAILRGWNVIKGDVDFADGNTYANAQGAMIIFDISEREAASDVMLESLKGFANADYFFQTYEEMTEGRFNLGGYADDFENALTIVGSSKEIKLDEVTYYNGYNYYLGVDDITNELYIEIEKNKADTTLASL